MSPRRFAVTGAAGFLGRALIDRLALMPEVERVLGVDIRPEPRMGRTSPKVEWAVRDVREPLGDLFVRHEIEAVAHLAYVLRPSHDRSGSHSINVGGARSVVGACEASGARAIVYPSSTTVYGAHPTYSRPYLETDPVNPLRGFQYSEDKVEAERLLASFAERTGRRIAILRAPPVMGPSAENFIVRSLTRRWLPSPSGANVEFQFLHIDDLLTTLVTMLTSDVDGIYNIAGDGSVRWRDMVRSFGNHTVPVPGGLLKAVVGLSWSLRLQSDSPSAGVDFIRFPWLADTSKARWDLGWRPQYSSEQALLAARPAVGIPQ